MRAKTKTLIQKNVESLILREKREMERDLALLTEDNISMAGGVAQMVTKRAEKIRGMSTALFYLVEDGKYLFPGMKLADLRIALSVARGMATMAATTVQVDLANQVPTPYANGIHEVYMEIARAIERKTGAAARVAASHR